MCPDHRQALKPQNKTQPHSPKTDDTTSQSGFSQSFSSPAPLSVMTLQKTIGNQAVQRLLVQRQPPPARPPGQLDANEQAFLNKTVEASSMVALAAGKFSSWLSSITIPYALGWSAHQNALRSAGEAAKNANAIALGTVLALIPGGIGGMVGKGMKGLGAGDAMVDGIKDLAKYGLREGGRAAGGGSGGSIDSAGARDPSGGAPTSGGSGFNAMPADPLVWQNYKDKRAEDEVLNPARAIVLEWQNKINNHDPNFDYNFDPVAAVREKLKLKDGPSLFELKEESQQDLLKGYEQGFLADWIETQAAPTFMKYSQFSWGKAREKVIKYGKSIGMEDVQTRLDAAVSKGVQENNDRARKSGHGLI